MISHINIPWEGSWYEGEPRGDHLTKEQKQIIKELDGVDLLGVSIDALPVKGLLSNEEVTALKEYQTTLIKDTRKEQYKAECDDMLFDLLADAVEAGKYPELKPWADKRKAIKEKFPVFTEAIKVVEK